MGRGTHRVAPDKDLCRECVLKGFASAPGAAPQCPPWRHSGSHAGHKPHSRCCTQLLAGAVVWLLPLEQGLGQDGAGVVPCP